MLTITSRALLRGTKFFSRMFGLATVSSFSGSESTIFALATGGVRCALAVIRVSGSETHQVIKRISRLESLPEPRKAIYKKLYDSTSNDATVLDHGILLWFPGPKSYTGEDSCEFHVHGGPAVITSIMRSIGNIAGCRMAEPGEFTKRAFLNGKMDLTEVDGLSDLISAETEMQRIQAINQLGGSLGRLYESWRDRIAKCLANAEAYIDFGEDENIEHDILRTVEREIMALEEEMKSHLLDKRKGERLRNGVHVAIIGKTNVGKSSLLNILCKREAAIVSEIPGTTRDVIETTVNFHGYPVVFADTAGIRSSTGDVIESEGMRRTVTQALKADLIILMLDTRRVEMENSPCSSHFKPLQSMDGLISEELSYIFLEELGTAPVDITDIKGKLFLVRNKMDLVPSATLKASNTDETTTGSASGLDPSFPGIIPISCKTNFGIENFIDTLSQRVALLCANPKTEALYLTQERYRSHLENCLSHLSLYLVSETTDLALKTQNLKSAMNCIGYITGHFGNEDILDILFRDFCIGK